MSRLLEGTNIVEAVHVQRGETSEVSLEYRIHGARLAADIWSRECRYLLTTGFDGKLKRLWCFERRLSILMGKLCQFDGQGLPKYT